jgi:hypothetical protein
MKGQKETDNKQRTNPYAEAQAINHLPQIKNIRRETALPHSTHSRPSLSSLKQLSKISYYAWSWLVTWYPDNVLNLLNLMCNRLKGGIPAGIPAGIGKLPKLEVLELWKNSITGPLPPSLSASRNHCNGSTFRGLCDNGNLTKLILFDKNFMCPIPKPGGAHLTRCSSLVRVHTRTKTRHPDSRTSDRRRWGLGKLRLLDQTTLLSWHGAPPSGEPAAAPRPAAEQGRRQGHAPAHARCLRLRLLHAPPPQWLGLLSRDGRPPAAAGDHAAPCPAVPNGIICCDRTAKCTDVCVMRGDVRTVRAGLRWLPRLQLLQVPYKQDLWRSCPSSCGVAFWSNLTLSSSSFNSTSSS